MYNNDNQEFKLYRDAEKRKELLKQLKNKKGFAVKREYLGKTYHEMFIPDVDLTKYTHLVLNYKVADNEKEIILKYVKLNGAISINLIPKAKSNDK